MTDSPINTNASPVVPAPAPAKPATKRKKATSSRTSGQLALPTPFNANRSPNMQLVPGLSDRYSKLELHKRGQTKKVVPVIGNKDIGHLVQFIACLVTSYTSGSGIASDGCSMYVDEYKDTVLKAVPTLGQYDLVFETSQSGPALNRIPIKDLIAMASQRAQYINADIRRFGLTKPSTRKSTKKPAPVVRGL